MKILYIVHQFFPNYSAGTEMVTYSLANMAQINGHQVKVITYACDGIQVRHEVCQKIHYRQYMVHKIPVIEFCHQELPIDITYAFYNQETMEFARKVLDEERPDVIHFTHMMRVGAFAYAAQERGIPYCMTFTDCMVICPRINMLTIEGEECKGCESGNICNKTCRHDLDCTARIQQAKNLVEKAYFCATPSKYLADKIKKELGHESQIVAHGLDYSLIKRKLSKKKNTTVPIQLAFVGTLAEHKGIEQLLTAFCSLQLNNLVLNVYGITNDPAYMKKLRKIAANNSNVVFHGQKDKKEIMNVYSTMDAVVIPSQGPESYCLVKNEALASNVFVIASNMGALPEGIENMKNGIVINAQRIDAIRSALKKIISKPEMLKASKNSHAVPIPSIEQEYFRYQAEYLNAIGR